MSEHVRPVVPSGRVGARSLLGLAVVAAVIVVGGSLAAAATQSPTFQRTDYPQLGSNHIVGDFNGDGRPDLAGLGAQSTAVLLATGDGTFGAKAEYAVASSPQDLAAGDFNGDGKLDLAVTINDPKTSLSLLTGTGTGAFSAPVNVANTSGFDSPAIVATDLTGDGKLDLVVAHQIGCFTAPCAVAKTISVMIGNGNGTFQPAHEVEVGTGMSRIAVGDFNRDGIKDLAIAGDQSRVYRLYGLGDGTFVQQPTLTLTADTLGVDATDIDVSDFNGDTIQDLVVAIGLNGSRTAVLIGNADGTFKTPLILTEPNLNVPTQQAVSDYNGDGLQDLAIGLANGDQGLFEIRNGNGDGTFQSPVMYQVPPPLSSIGTVAIVAANLSSDTKADMALAIGGASPALAVLINSTAVAPPPVPAAPTLITPAQDATPAQPVFFDWTDVTAASSYTIQIDDSSNFTSPLVVEATVTASQFTAPILAAKRHWWRVRGVNSAGIAGAWSSVRRFTPKAAPAPASLSAVSVNPTTVVGGNTSQGTVTLTSAAGSGGFAVSLSSSNSAATVPATVTVAQGQTSVSFTISTSAVATTTSATITASAGGVTRTAAVTVTAQGQMATLMVTATGRSGERVLSNPAGINVAVGSTGSASFATGTTITLSATNERDVIWSGACSSGGQKTKTCTFTLIGNSAVTANVQ